MAPVVLVIEDDPAVAKILRHALEAEGFGFVHAADGTSGLELAERDHPEFVILDRRLPGMDGLEVCRRLRAASPVPILMLTAAAEEVDKLVGLSIGADDYVTKPFSPREVVARMKAILRRLERPTDGKLLRRAELVMDVGLQRVTLAGAEVPLTHSEFKVLKLLLEHPGRPFDRDSLLEEIYPLGERDVIDRAIDVHVTNLRRKLGDDPSRPLFIATVRGVGYKLL